MAFPYRTPDDLRREAEALGISLPWSDDLSILASPLPIAGSGLVVPNRLAVHPMEGNDGTAEGAPAEGTFRRYERFAAGGAGLLWFEAVAVVEEGRAVPFQLKITRDNLPLYAQLRKRIDRTAADRFGSDFRPVVVAQLTHSGRFSKPTGVSAPKIAYRNPVLDQKMKVPEEVEPVSDEYLDELPDRFAAAALLCREAGFDGVDVKSCHRYLLSELLSAFDRPGRYGGTFEHRIRLILDVSRRIREAVGPDPDFLVTARLNLFDGILPPLGFGTDAGDAAKLDLSEPLALVARLHDDGLRLLNITMGTPYFNPHVNRPYDTGGYVPPEHPLFGVARLLDGAAAVQRTHPDLAVVGTGFSWLRQFAPHVAAGVIRSGGASLVGFGRQAFAYPEFAVDILEKGALDPHRCCVTCGKCSDILRAGGPAGCVVRDAGRYLEPYRSFCGK
jgi:2,4-dienoyl-CoA reductase-like NADH-dependent reductase (Old Yellow Enzyme family)